jgi:hypothetical protein
LKTMHRNSSDQLTSDTRPRKIADSPDRWECSQAGLRRPVFRQRNNTISNGVMHYSQRTKYLDR